MQDVPENNTAFQAYLKGPQAVADTSAHRVAVTPPTHGEILNTLDAMIKQGPEHSRVGERKRSWNWHPASPF